MWDSYLKGYIEEHKNIQHMVTRLRLDIKKDEINGKTKKDEIRDSRD